MSNQSPPDVTLALPAYNESANIEGVLDASVAALERLARSFEIIVIDNCSSDATPKIVEEYGRRDARITLIQHESNRLYSGSCASAIAGARGRYIAIMDSDGQCTAEDLPSFIAAIENGANFVLGSRRPRRDPLSRKMISAVFNGLGRLLLKTEVEDLNCGIRMFDRTFAEVAVIRHRINMSNPELLVRARNAGLRIAEVRITHRERAGGETSHNFSKLGKIFVEVLRYFLALRAELER